jgi:hypothetical protein
MPWPSELKPNLCSEGTAARAHGRTHEQDHAMTTLIVAALIGSPLYAGLLPDPADESLPPVRRVGQQAGPAPPVSAAAVPQV